MSKGGSLGAWKGRQQERVLSLDLHYLNLLNLEFDVWFMTICRVDLSMVPYSGPTWRMMYSEGDSAACFERSRNLALQRTLSMMSALSSAVVP